MKQISLTKFHIVVSASLLVLIQPADTHASVHDTRYHTIDPAEVQVDSIAPVAPAVALRGIVRGQSPENGSAMSQQALDDDLGRITLFVSSNDDRTPPDSIGYHLLFVGGGLPIGLDLPERPVRSHRVIQAGSRLDLITLEWADDATNTQEPFDFDLTVLAVDRAGNTSLPSDTIRVVHSGSRVDILFNFGVESRNRLDTSLGTFTKDMIVDPPITIQLNLTEDERKQVVAKAEEIGFFDLPDRIVPDRTSCERTPCGSYYLKIRVGRVIHHVSWDDCTCWEMQSLLDLRLMLQSMIRSKEAYKRSPEPRGAYY